MMDNNLYGELVSALLWTVFLGVECVFVLLMMSDKFKKSRKFLGKCFIIIAFIGACAHWGVAVSDDKHEAIPAFIAKYANAGNNCLVVAAKWTTPAFAKKELEKNPWITTAIRWVLNHGAVSVVEQAQAAQEGK